MIFLDNYSKKNTYINITSEGYSIVDAKSINDIKIRRILYINELTIVITQ